MTESMQANTNVSVGFIGLGSMGSAMAANLVRAGYPVQVWNRSPAPVDALVAQGARAAADAAEVFGSNDVVVSMLANDAAVEGIVLDAGVLAGAKPGAVHVNMATVSVATAERATRDHEVHGVAYVAAPVLGRPNVAAAGELNIIAAGPAEALDRVEAVLAVLGRRTWRFGTRPAHANTVKIAVNHLLACAIGAMGEASTLVEAAGLDAGAFAELITGTLFDAPAYKGYAPMIAGRSYEPAGFRLSLGLKDVNLAIAGAAEHHVPMPIAGVMRDLFTDALAHGGGDLDWSAVAEVSRRRAGLD